MDGCAAALYYTGKVKQAMRRFKFHHKQHYADWFARRPFPCWPDIWRTGSPI